MNRIVEFSAGANAMAVDLDSGCRIASLAVAGEELLVTQGESWIDWGSYPMAPWAGRVRNGVFRFHGVEYRLPRNFGDHAIHGTVCTAAWDQIGDAGFACRLTEPWPFSGEVVQEFDLGTDSLEVRLEVRSDEPMPAVCGWHPWFRRTIARSDVTIELDARFMLRRDESGIATARKVPPPEGPWDDCFGDLTGPPVLSWPGVLSLTVESSCRYVVVFDEWAHAVCVEPQTEPPNALNHAPFVVVPGAPLVATMRWSWRSLRG